MYCVYIKLLRVNNNIAKTQKSFVNIPIVFEIRVVTRVLLVSMVFDIDLNK